MAHIVNQAPEPTLLTSICKSSGHDKLFFIDFLLSCLHYITRNKKRKLVGIIGSLCLWMLYLKFVNNLSHIMRKPVYANNKGEDQPAHPRRLISAFVVRCLDIIIALLGVADISRP